MTGLHTLLVLAVVSLLAGCTTRPSQDQAAGSLAANDIPATGLSETPSGQVPEESASPKEGDGSTPAVEPRLVRVYEWQGVDVGTDPHQVLPGGVPLVNEPWGPREGSFVAPPGTVGLGVTLNLRVGAWSGGIEIVHESGLVVYRQEYLVNANDGGWGGCFFSYYCTRVHLGGGVWPADSAPPGNYTVLYRFVGAVEGTVTVDALLEA